MSQVDFTVRCSVVDFDELSEKGIEVLATELEELLKENGYKKVDVEVG